MNRCPATEDFGADSVGPIEAPRDGDEECGCAALEGEAQPSTGPSKPRSLSVTGALLTRSPGDDRDGDAAESDMARFEGSDKGVCGCCGEDVILPDGAAASPVAAGTSA